MVKIETTQTKNQTMGTYETYTPEVVLPPYSKRAFIAIILVIPVAFAINIPLNSMVFFMPVWGTIMINAIVISSYMVFIMPKASKLFSTRLNSTTKGVN